MGDVKRVLVTGAAGFLGQEIVAEGLHRGLAVTALVRRKESAEALRGRFSGIEIFTGDLAEGEVPDCARFDVVIHAAAAFSGGDEDHQRDTLTATRTLMAAMRGGKAHLVLISSLSVYDFARLKAFHLLDEGAALEARPEFRDAYCRAKLRQEGFCRDWATAGRRLTILRPGQLYAADHFSPHHLGLPLGSAFIAFGHSGAVPLLHVKNCASAAVHFAQADKGGVFNLVDGDLPGVKAVLAHCGLRPTMTLPWRALGLIGGLTRPFWNILPGLLRGPVIAARARPLRFSNAKALEAGWRPGVSFPPERSMRGSPGHRTQFSAVRGVSG